MNTLSNKELENHIVEKAGEMLQTYESNGQETAFELWRKLDQSIGDKRNALSTEVLDLVLQLEFFLENHPESDLGDLQHALYCARVAVEDKMDPASRPAS